MIQMRNDCDVVYQAKHRMVLLTDILQQRGREELRILRNRSMAERISLLLLKVAAIC